MNPSKGAKFSWGLLGGVAILTYSPAVRANPDITYQVQDRTLTATVDGVERILFNLAAGNPTSLFREADSPFLSQYQHGFTWIEVVEDLDQDGFPDAVVGLSQGGNCCAPGYAIVSALPDGSFRFSPLLEWTWNPPQVIPETNGEILLETRTDDRLYRHRYQDGQVVLLEERTVAELAAIAELRAQEVIEGSSNSFLEIDLNADGVTETMDCAVWERWQSLRCTFAWSDGSILQTVQQSDESGLQEVNLGCFRYGVLPSMTNGMHDLVCNVDAIARWNGNAYEWQDDSF